MLHLARFKNRKADISNDEYIKWFLSEEGQPHWYQIQAAAGVKPRPYNSEIWEIEHLICGSRLDGADHWLNHYIAPKNLNRAVELLYGAGEVKMAMLGLEAFTLMNRFHVWQLQNPSEPCDKFLQPEVLADLTDKKGKKKPLKDIKVTTAVGKVKAR